MRLLWRVIGAGFILCVLSAQSTAENVGPPTAQSTVYVEGDVSLPKGEFTNFPEEWRECHSDADCEMFETHCSVQIAFNKKYEEQVHQHNFLIECRAEARYAFDIGTACIQSQCHLVDTCEPQAGVLCGEKQPPKYILYADQSMECLYRNRQNLSPQCSAALEKWDRDFNHKH